jgi:hypothetical protein
MSTQEILALVFNTVMAAVFLFAIVRGGRPERLGVLINLVGFGATTAFRLLFGAIAWAPGDVATMTIDLAVGGGFFWLGVTTIRFWPIWAAGFVLADLFMSLFGRLLPNIHLFAYHTGLGIYAYLALGALALGTFRLPRGAEPHIRHGSRKLWLQHLKETS